MKSGVVHVVSSAINAPHPDQVYGAKVASFRLVRGKVEISWKIFARKNRKKKTPAAK